MCYILLAGVFALNSYSAYINGNMLISMLSALFFGINLVLAFSD